MKAMTIKFDDSDIKRISAIAERWGVTKTWLARTAARTGLSALENGDAPLNFWANKKGKKR